MWNPIIEALKKQMERLNPTLSKTNTDYMSGYNDGAYALWRYLYEPKSVPNQVLEDVQHLSVQAHEDHNYGQKEKAKELLAQFGSQAKYVCLEIKEQLKRLSSYCAADLVYPMEYWEEVLKEIEKRYDRH